MAPLRSANWEEQFLSQGLSQRAKRAGTAYTGPGAGFDIPLSGRPPIAFTGGIPDPSALPIEALAAASDRVLRRDSNLALEYGGAQGFAGLRAWLAGHWSKLDALELTPENFTLTLGSSQALENVCETFLSEGETVIVEAPSFPGSIRTIASLGCTLESVCLDADGLNVDALEEKLRDIERHGRRVKLLYTIPNYHNPTGVTLAWNRRQRLIDLCERHDVLIVEDDAYGELGFDGEPPPSLYSLARGRGVIKIGTFSKIIATGLRVGWVQATQPIIHVLLATRFDMGLSPFLLRTIAEFAGNGQLEAHIAALCRLYGRKRDVIISELRERCSGLATWNVPHGGFFVWLELNEKIDPLKLSFAAEEEGVLFGNGRNFFPPVAEDAARGASAGQANFVRLAFSYTSEPQIPEGVRRLARALERAKRE